jgi:hypothetical protein
MLVRSVWAAIIIRRSLLLIVNTFARLQISTFSSMIWMLATGYLLNQHLLGAKPLWHITNTDKAIMSEALSAGWGYLFEASSFS